MFSQPSDTKIQRRQDGRRSTLFSFFLYFMGSAYIFAGLMHFLRTPLYIAIMPSYLPYPEALVFLSGIAEVSGGVGILMPQTRRIAAWGLVLLLIAVFPANITMLDRAYLFPRIPLWALWLRLPLQLLLIAWAAVYTKKS